MCVYSACLFLLVLKLYLLEEIFTSTLNFQQII